MELIIKNNKTPLIYFFFILFLYGQDITEKTTLPKNIYRSAYGGAFKVSPILSEEESRIYELKLKDLSEKLNKHTTNLSNLMLADTISVPKHFTFFGGIYTKPRLTEKQKIAAVRKDNIRNLKYLIQRLNIKRVTLLKEYQKLKSRDAKYVQKELFWGFISWEEKKSLIPFDNKN